jgi:hypothetical protein
MNKNQITTEGFSNPDSAKPYRDGWPDDPTLSHQHYLGEQCGDCSFFAQFNSDWGLCCNGASPHHLETVFEHFTCHKYIHEGWGPHSFSASKEDHCKCGGGSFSEATYDLVSVLEARLGGLDEGEKYSVLLHLGSFLLKKERLVSAAQALTETGGEVGAVSKQILRALDQRESDPDLP